MRREAYYMRQKLGRILLGLSVLTAAILYLPADIYAAGSVSVTADKTDVGGLYKNFGAGGSVCGTGDLRHIRFG